MKTISRTLIPTLEILYTQRKIKLDFGIPIVIEIECLKLFYVPQPLKSCNAVVGSPFSFFLKKIHAFWVYI